jgi:hypothetical protein
LKEKEKIMDHWLDNLNIKGLLARIQCKKLLASVTTKYEYNNNGSTQVSILRGVMTRPHIGETDIKDFGGIEYRTRLDPIIKGTWCFHLNDVNQVYEQNYEMAMCFDQIVINAMNADTHMKEFPYDPNKPLIDLLLDCKCAIDSAIDDIPPMEGRELILPAAAQKAMFNDKKFMGSLHMQCQMGDIMSGKNPKLFGFNTLFMPDRKQGGLRYEIQPDGRRLYTCYALCPGALCSAERYGDIRVLDDKGEILQSNYIPREGCYFIYITYQADAKVVLHQRIVRFYMMMEADDLDEEVFMKYTRLVEEENKKYHCFDGMTRESIKESITRGRL